MLEKKYHPHPMEEQMQSFWAENQVYRFCPDSEKPIFSIDTPPPTVSGSLHIGHIFSYTQAEMIARFARAQGNNVFYPFGFDDNGLPTERLTEREHGVRAKNLSREEFAALCTRTAEKYEEEFRNLWQSLGFSVNWSLLYRTASPESIKISQRSFLELAEKGNAYQKQSPVLWCTQCQTSIAQAELDTADRESAFHTLAFPCGDGFLPVATTRPELLYGCVCLLVNPSDGRWASFAGQTAQVPLYDYEIPILADEKVEQEKGSGVVMCATFGDSTDVEWAEQYGFAYRRVITPDGTVDPGVPLVGNLTVLQARKEIVGLLEAAGALLESKPLIHAVAVHERCGTEVEILPSRQWYLDVLSRKQRYLEAAEEIQWYPASMKSRYLRWVENLKWDWCISRQRYFGVPFPVWECKHCGRPMFAREDELPVNPMTQGPGRACACGSREFEGESAVMDTWATSSLTPMINAAWGSGQDRVEKLLPMTMRTQAHEIIRTWAFYTIVKSLYHTGRVPWKNMMICGFVLAKKGEKISKSKNNAVLSPQALTRQYGADALRYWAAGARLGTDTFFSPDELAASGRFLTKLWNAARFAAPHLELLDSPIPGKALPTDRWILERYRQTAQKAAEYLREYEIGSARKEIDRFFWDDFCDGYLELVKERLYEPEKRGEALRIGAAKSLRACLLGLLKLYGIYVPHITEKIYQECLRDAKGPLSLHSMTWDEGETPPDRTLLRFGERLQEVLSAVRRHKSERSLSLKAPLAQLSFGVESDLRALFVEGKDDLKACCGAEKINLREESFPEIEIEE